MVHSTIQHPRTPTPPPHCLYIYTLNLVWEGGEGGGGQREGRGATVHKYSIVTSSMGATVHKLGRKYKP
jgi:hypothetical protein